MSETYSIRTAIYDHLATLAGSVPIQSAYVGGDAVTPRYEVAIVGENNETFLLDGGTKHTAEIQITAVVAKGKGEADFGALVSAIQNHFPPQDRIGGIVVVNMPEARPPILDGDEFRIPILIRYRAIIAA